MTHFSAGKSISGEERPINIDKLGNIKIFTSSLTNHKNYYDFEGPDDVIDNFLLKVKSKFIPSTEISVKCSFCLKTFNLHQLKLECSLIISDIDRQANMWQNSDYLFFSLKRDIKKGASITIKVVAPGDFEAF